ncbi:MAG: hypothetical protein F4086_06080 [Gemmatimonadetes bacterium]|nr:hypothetical protein [Gemmatimonadota bacterium]MYJ09865.1 hypothetical protein [Gemmatimonadota bacterium]
MDLKNFEEVPDVFFVPSSVIAEYFEAGPENWPRARYHPTIDEVAQYRNNWDSLRQILDGPDDRTLTNAQ